MATLIHFINGKCHKLIKSSETCLTNHTQSISHHITPLVINALGGIHTDRLTHIPTSKPKQFQETRHTWLLAGLKVWFIVMKLTRLLLEVPTRHWNDNFIFIIVSKNSWRFHPVNKRVGVIVNFSYQEYELKIIGIQNYTILVIYLHHVKMPANYTIP